MATEVQNAREMNTASLVTGIVSDVQDLVKQQLQLTRKEIEADLRKTRQAASLLMAGIAVLLPAAFTLCLMLAHLFYFVTANAVGSNDTNPFPLWACYGVVTAVLAAVGGGMAFAGKKKFDSFNPLPDESAKV